MNDNRLKRIHIKTPYGKMVALSTGKGLAALEFLKPDRNQLLHRRLKKWFPGYAVVDVNKSEEDTILSATRMWLENYFNGQFDQLVPPPLDLKGTEFELKVWQALLQLPLGKTSSYGELARKLERPKASRAVGSCNRKNPVSLIVPCHRVIGQNGKLVGYGGGIDVKKALIAHEADI